MGSNGQPPCFESVNVEESVSFDILVMRKQNDVRWTKHIHQEARVTDEGAGFFKRYKKYVTEVDISTTCIAIIRPKLKYNWGVRERFKYFQGKLQTFTTKTSDAHRWRECFYSYIQSIDIIWTVWCLYWGIYSTVPQKFVRQPKLSAELLVLSAFSSACQEGVLMSQDRLSPLRQSSTSLSAFGTISALSMLF